MSQDIIPFGEPDAPPAGGALASAQSSAHATGSPNVPETLVFIECMDCGQNTERSVFAAGGCVHCALSEVLGNAGAERTR